jgi:amino acid adenylation domain-containing protein/non-ribosomal peptide synthase protein (TIGR01720 family)
MKNKDYSEKQILVGSRKIKEKKFWLNELSDLPEKSRFPYDYDIKKTGPVESDVDAVTFTMTDELFTKLTALSNHSDVRLHFILVAGLVALLRKYIPYRDDILVGVPIYKQKSEGRFINTVLPIRNRLQESMTFKELLMQVGQNILKAGENQNFPIETLFHQLNIPYSEQDDFPLFDISILLKNIHHKEYIRHIRHNMTFSFLREDGHIEGVVEYHSASYDTGTIDRIARHYRNLLQNALSDANTKVIEIDVLSQEEKKQLLYDFNDTESEYPSGKTIPLLFEEQVKRTPDNTAVVSPMDLNDIFDELESEETTTNLSEKLGPCCFKKNPYLHQWDMELPDNGTGLKGIKTHRHNNVIVNPNMVRLLDLFDGQRTTASIFSLVKNINLRLFIFPLETDILEVTANLNKEAAIYSNRKWDDFVRLVKDLYNHYLIELEGVDINTGEAEIDPTVSIGDYFDPEGSLDETSLGQDELLGRKTDLPNGRVLLLGDTPGMPTTGLLYLGSYLRRNGITTYCQFNDSTEDYAAMKKNLEDLLEKIQPEVVAVSLKWFPYIARVLDMCKIVKEYANRNTSPVKVVVGGNTASYYWEQIAAYDAVDYVVCGDGEEPLLAICRGTPEENIPNCIYKKDGKIIKNPIGYVQDKTHSTGIYLSHLDEILLSKHASKFGTFFIYTHKGCAMNCLYCGGCSQAQQKTFNRKKVLRRGVEEVRKDLLEACKYTSTFQFDFDTIQKNLLDYCKGIWEGIDLSDFFCIITTLAPPSPAFIHLVSTTFKYVYWDFDVCTLSQRHRQQLASLGLVKPQPSDEEILEFFQHCESQNNIEVRVNLITGLPYFTAEDIKTSEKFLSHIMNHFFCFSELHWARLHAQPGAPVMENAPKYEMYSYASVFEDFLEYSRKNFNKETTYAHMEDLIYPYIYFEDDDLNSKVTRFYSENNQKVETHRQNNRRQLTPLQTLSFRELNLKANQLAATLREKGVTAGSIVGLVLSPSTVIPLGILAVLKTSASYLPIDPQYPVERIAYLLDDSKSKLVITQKEFIGSISFDGEILDIDEKNLYKGEGKNTNIPTIPEDIVYTIYTSGTTGKPKGVLVKNKNLVNYFFWFIKKTLIREEDRTILTSSFAFDLGYSSLYTALLTGCQLHLLPRNIYLLADKLMNYIRENKISYIKVTPSLFSVMVNSPGFTPENCCHLRLVLVGGEPIIVKDIQLAHDTLSHIQIINHYGPTEATIGCVAEMIDFSSFHQYKQRPTIGKPIHNTNVFILDKHLNVQPVGVPGELCISGACLARGYLNNPELTAKKFNRSYKSYMSYKTGDLARWTEDGRIEFLGRMDNQVKIRGYRIELEEIRSRLLLHPQIEEALVIDRKDETGDKYICAYIVPAEKNSLEPQERAVDIARFESQVTAHPDKIAVKSPSGTLTYHNLNRTANHIAYRIEEEYDDRYALSDKEKTRYARQMLLHGWGAGSQERLKSTTVFVAGAGGGASPTIMQLALAGIGTIIVCDYDDVELSNLNRQFLHDESRIGMNKALSTKITINKINPNVNVFPITEKLTRENVFELVGDSAVIFDMLDNQTDKFILSECAAVKGIPHVISAMTDISSYAALFHPPHTPCFHCIFDKNKLEELITGMKGFVKNYEKNPLPVAAASLFVSTGFAVNEAIKIILGLENPAYNKYFFFNQSGSDSIRNSDSFKAMTYTYSDHFRRICKEQGFDWDIGWRGRFLEELEIKPDPDCPLCGVKGKQRWDLLEERLVKSSIRFLTEIRGSENEKPQTVALLMNHDLHLPTGLIGILKSGKTCVYLDPALPGENLRRLLEDSGARVVLTDNQNLDKAGKVRDAVNKYIPVISIAERINNRQDQGQNIDVNPEPGKTRPSTHTLDSALIPLFDALFKGETVEPPLQVPNLNNHSFSQLRDYLLKDLPEYMIPSYFFSLEAIPLTPNGKVDKKALPEPGDAAGKEAYAPPSNEIEEQLAEIWCQVLGIERIGINDNFFELGLDSIKAIQVSARMLNKKLKVEARDIFANPTIKELGQYVQKADRPIDQRAIEGEVPLTPIQQWFFEKKFKEKNHFNMAVMFYKESGFDQTVVEKVFTKILEHHDALRIVYAYADEGSEIKQENRSPGGKLFDLEVVDLCHAGNIEEEISKKANRIQQQINLTRGPLVKLGLFKTPSGHHLLIVIHHLVTDAVSIRILLEDFASGYRQAENKREIKFPQKTDSFKEWAQKLKRYAVGEEALSQLEYWAGIANTGVENLPRDFDVAAEDKKNKNRKNLRIKLTKEETENLLKKVNKAYNTEINDILLAALGMAVNQWAGIEKVTVNLEGHGRESILEDVDISRTVGWFTTQYPVVLDMSRPDHLPYTVKCVKETLRRIPHKGIGYGILKYLTPPEKKEGFNLDIEPPFNFNYLGEFGQEKEGETPHLGISSMDAGQSISDQMEHYYTIGINGMIAGGELILSVDYNTCEYKKENIERFAHYYKEKLTRIIAHCIAKGTIDLTPVDVGYGEISIEKYQELESFVNKWEGNRPGIESIYPLSPGQKAFLIHTLENKAHRTQSILHLHGEVDYRLFQKAYELLGKRFEVLRTVFYFEDLKYPLQIVLKEKRMNVHFEDISGLTSDEKERRLEEFKEKDWENGFQLEKEAMRVSLVKTEDNSHVLFWSVHRNIIDGWCIGILFVDFIQLYRSLLEAQPIQLPPVTPYQKYVEWMEQKDRTQWIAYWAEYLEDYHQEATLPEYRESGKENAFKLGEYQFQVEERLVEGLNRIARENKTTLNTLFQTLWGIVLQKFNKRDDVVFGATVHGRSTEVEGIENMVGLFVNTVPVRIRTGDARTFLQLLTRVQEKSQWSKPYEYTPMAEIQAVTPLKQKLIDSNMIFQNYPIKTQFREMNKQMGKEGRHQSIGFTVSNTEFHVQTNFNINIFVNTGTVIYIEFSFNAAVYHPHVLKEAALSFKKVIEQIVENPGINLEDVKIFQDKK